MIIHIFLDDLMPDKKAEVMLALGEDLDKWFDKPIVSIEFDEEAVF